MDEVPEASVSSTSPSHRISIYFSYILRPPLEGRALHSQECFLPLRGGFNLRCTRERYIPKNVSIRGVQILRSYDAPSLPRKDNRFDQELTSAGGESATFPRMFSFVTSIEPELYFTEPPDFHIFLLYPPASAGGESATFPRMFSSPRGGFNLRCTRERDIPQECFL